MLAPGCSGDRRQELGQTGLLILCLEREARNGKLSLYLPSKYRALVRISSDLVREMLAA